MIALATTASYRAIASEFFELFKTAWEFYRDDAEYDAVICCGIEPTDIRSKLVLVYAPHELSFDRQHGLTVLPQPAEAFVIYRERQLPIFQGLARFEDRTHTTLVTRMTKSASGQHWIRIGYNLLAEVQHLLTCGQPSEFAQSPSIEMHIAMLRDILVQNRVRFEEVPPIPAGYNFITCLTHDVDNFAVRNHRFDHTILGFLYRASIGSLIDFCRGRKTLAQVGRNYATVLSLPLVYLRVLPDFWSRPERYLEMEPASTFFIIPKKGDAGLSSDGAKLPRRAAQYELAQLQTSIRRILAQGGEIAVHGIDAWRDPVAARDEQERVRSVTNSSEIGIRMHWLFFDAESPTILEEAGYSYDSTIGYNNAVGYRAGTTQAFKPLGMERLLELPLHIMDTALFYPAHLNLSPRQARERLNALVNDAKEFGGVLTINWHDRSIAPERLWDDFYLEFIRTLQEAGACFCTGGEATRWFRKRRSIDFKANGKCKYERANDGLPGLRVRSYRGEPAPQFGVGREPVLNTPFHEILFGNCGEMVHAVS